jgi:transmembrane sensor
MRFIEWVRQSADHLAAFLRADDTFCRLAGMDQSRRIDVDELRQRSSNHIKDQDRSFPAEPAEPPARKRHGQLLAWAASMLLAIAGAFIWVAMKRTPVYTTGIGEQLSVKLPDGSMMTLNTKSRATIEFTAEQRLVYLQTGEALFEVEHDERRPFMVRTPSAQVRDIGTRFNVYQHDTSGSNRDAATTVSVLEGVVQIAAAHRAADSEKLQSGGSTMPTTGPGSEPPEQSAIRLVAGEQANVSKIGVTRAATEDVSDAVAWRARELVFHGTPLEDVAAEYNRYNAKKIRIHDPDIAQRRMSGTFSADRPQLLVLYLQNDSSVSVKVSGSDWIIDKQ